MHSTNIRLLTLLSWSLILCQNVENGKERDIMESQFPCVFLAKLLNKDIKYPYTLAEKEEKYF